LQFLRVALLFPEPKEIAFSNLAVHFFFNIFKDIPGFDIFTTDNHESCFTKKKISDFEIVFVSMSYEYSYLNLANYFKSLKIPLHKDKRNSRYHPLFIAGGVALMLNPAPLFDLFDIILTGEGEKMEEDLFSILKMDSADSIIDFASSLSYGLTKNKRNASIIRASTGDFLVHSNEILHQSGNCFGNRYIIELNRGCDERCHFCAASFIYKNYREANAEKALNAAQNALEKGMNLALMGTSLNTVSFFDEIVDKAIKYDAGISLSSVKINSISEELLEKLKKTGVRNITIAMESADMQTRSLIHKKIEEESILNAIELITYGMKTKLYLIAGLPGTIPEKEVDALKNLIQKIYTNKRKPRLSLSFAPFSPKPFTPFQGKAMMTKNSYKKLQKNIYHSISSISKDISLDFFAYSESVVQAFLGRGDESMLKFLETYSETGDIKKTEEVLNINIEKIMSSELENEKYPWKRFISC